MTAPVATHLPWLEISIYLNPVAGASGAATCLGTNHQQYATGRGAGVSDCRAALLLRIQFELRPVDSNVTIRKE
jgi:hypothetical protein